jgi:ketosteroid isomerase-like protein
MTALETVQAYIRAMERRDKEAVAETLAADVLHVFPVSGGPNEMAGIFEGRDEVLGYFDAFAGKFRSLVWINKVWTESADGRTVFLEARGDAVVEHSGASYHNLYVQRFDVEAEKIVRIIEYADQNLYLAMGIPPTRLEADVVAATPERAARLKPLG